MPQGRWELPIYERANPSNQLIGVVVFQDDDIVALISQYDFRDTNLDGDVSIWEVLSASVGFNRSMFVATAVKQLKGAIVDYSFDVNQIGPIERGNFVSAVQSVGAEVLQDAAVSALLGEFTGPILSEIVSRFGGDAIAQIYFTYAGEALIDAALGVAFTTVPPDVQYNGYAVRYVGNETDDDIVLGEAGGSNSTPQYIVSTGSGRSLGGASGADTLVVGSGGIDRFAGGEGLDAIIFDGSNQAVGQTISNFATQSGSEIRLFNGAVLSDVEQIDYTFGAGDDVVTNLNMPGSLTTTLRLGAGNDTASVAEGNYLIVGGAGTDTVISDLQDSDFAVRAYFSEKSTLHDKPHLLVRTVDQRLGTLSTSIFESFEERVIYGSRFDDNLQIEFTNFYPSKANDKIYAGAGDDFIISGRGVDFIDGGPGDDYLTINTSDYNEIFPITGGFDTDFGLTLPNGSVIKNVEKLFIFAGNANHHVTNRYQGGPDVPTGDLEVRLGSGDDTIEVFGGKFSVSAGGGYDKLTLDLRHSNQDVYLGDGGASEAFMVTFYLDDMFNPVDTSQQIYFENIEELIVFGGSGNDAFVMTEKNDIAYGGLGNDTMTGGGGFDLRFGGPGDDAYEKNDDLDLFFENPDEGTDYVFTSLSTYLLANIEMLQLNQGSGNIFGVGNELNNLMWGNESENLLIAQAGNDEVRGGAARDSIFGQQGDDRLFGDDGVDYIVAGPGNDIVNGGLDPDEIYGEDGDDELSGGTGFFTDILVGGAGNDIIYGDSRSGDYDLLYGNTGNDVYYVDTPSDLVFEQFGEGQDTVYATIVGAGYYLYDNIENLILLGNTPFGVGNALSNNLTGNAAGNYLLGGAGYDRLNGLGGNDVLFGEAGDDIFVFERRNGADVIGDFLQGRDRIELVSMFGSFDILKANFVQNGADGAINLGGGNIIVLPNVVMANLTAVDFIFS